MVCVFSMIVQSYMFSMIVQSYDCSESTSNVHISSFIRYEHFVKPADVHDFWGVKLSLALPYQNLTGQCQESSALPVAAFSVVQVHSRNSTHQVALLLCTSLHTSSSCLEPHMVQSASQPSPAACNMTPQGHG